MHKSIFCLFFLASLEIFGQAPGYLGNRTFLKGDLGTMITRGPTANNRGHNSGELYGEASGNLGFNTQFSVQAGHVYSRNQAVLLEFSELKTGLVSRAISPVINNPSETDFFDDHYLFYQLRARSIGLGYHAFNLGNGGLAPFGGFMSLYVDRNSVTGDIIDKRTDYHTFGLPIHANLDFEPELTYWSAGIGFGQQRVLFDRVLLGFEWRFNFPLSVFKYFTNFGGTEADDIKPNPDLSYNSEAGAGVFNLQKFENDAFDRVVNHNLIYFRVGVGLLLF